MRDLESYALRCMEKLDQLGIKYGNILAVTPNTRAKSRWGQCRKVPGGYTININVDLLDEESGPDGEEGLINTLLHELLHSCEGCMNHGPNWKALAATVYRATGYNIKRTSSAEEKGMTPSIRAVKYKYAVQCECCGHVFYRQKACKLTKHPEWFRCGICKGSLVKIS